MPHSIAVTVITMFILSTGNKFAESWEPEAGVGQKRRTETDTYTEYAHLSYKNSSNNPHIRTLQYWVIYITEINKEFPLPGRGHNKTIKNKRRSKDSSRQLLIKWAILFRFSLPLGQTSAFYKNQNIPFSITLQQLPSYKKGSWEWMTLLTTIC